MTPVMRAHGFKGSAPTWRRWADNGDCAIASIGTVGGITITERRCTVKVALAPTPWVDWLWRNEPEPPKQVGLGEALYLGSLQPKEPKGWGPMGSWVIEGPEDIAPAVLEMVQQLDEVGLPKCIELLDRSNLLQAVRVGDLGFYGGSGSEEFCQRVLAMLLSDLGPSDELSGLISQIRGHSCGFGITKAGHQEVIDFVQRRAERFGSGGLRT